ncbi:hypothetical protein [Acinetobacter nosocomialis]|uniref:hypothetical protein n=1 Tax=Acinetobacter nosocomialis TaxID=106654 RepID=UPI001250129E
MCLVYQVKTSCFFSTHQFMIIFYLAINNEPDYMPSQKNKQMMETHEQMNHAEMHSSSAQ